MKSNLNNLQKEALEKLNEIESLKKLYELEVQYLGRKGKLTQILRELKNLPAEEKPKMGKLSNEIKQFLIQNFSEKKAEIENSELEKELSKDFFDTTLPPQKREIGHIHPLSQTQEEVEKIFGYMGFSIMDGPEAESEYYNFEALNIPKGHPARDMQDTFFIQDKKDKKHGNIVLRAHTSPVQIRTMEKYGAPLRIIIPGRVFRNEATDASHEHTFNQVEGLLIDKEISLSHLKGVMKEFLSKLFEKQIKVRFRPGYFPFVEPGLELDFSCLLCNEKGCNVCKQTGWVELMGCGMVHENVLKAGGIDPKKYQGWAFGFGLNRLIMMRYQINDIRHLASGDLRFIKQF